MACTETRVTTVSAVDYRLEVTIPRVHVDARILAELEVRRAAMRAKGYRPGKVPLEQARQAFGRRIAETVTYEVIFEAFRSALAERTDLAVLGEPRLVERHYSLEGGGDLRAVVQFAVWPDIEVADHLGPITRFTRHFSEQDIDAEIEQRRAQNATLEPLSAGECARAGDVARVDIEPVDPSGAPVGPLQRDGEIALADPRVPSELASGIIGRRIGDQVTVELTSGPGGLSDRYRLVIRDIRRALLPGLDEGFVRTQTGGAHGDLSRFREEVRRDLEQSWQRRSAEQLRRKMIARFVEFHRFEVPETLVETRLDELAHAEGKRRSTKAEFDEHSFRTGQRSRAEAEVRWRLLRQRLIATDELEATEADFEEEYQNFLGGSATVDTLRADFAAQPRLRQRVAAQIVDRRVDQALARRFEIVDKSRDDVLRRINGG
jgi:trigger factor